MIPVRYVNGRGDEINLSGDGIWVSPTALIEWELDALTASGVVKGFTYGSKTVSLDAVVYKPGAAQRLYNVPSYDVYEKSPGRLYVGDWYVRCWITASSPIDWWLADDKCRYTLKAATDDPVWRRDYQHSYVERQESEQGLDFPYDFPYDFGTSLTTISVDNTAYLPADLIIRMYGPCDSPSLTVGGNEYGADVVLTVGEYLEIDTVSKSVGIVRINGLRDNAFDKIIGEYREGSGSYIFEKIAPGLNNVTWSGGFDFDITIVERRREPVINGPDMG